MISTLPLPRPVHSLYWLSERWNVDLWFKRNDLIPQFFGGNKFRKAFGVMKALGELTNSVGDSGSVVPYTVGDSANTAAALEQVHTHAALGHLAAGPLRRLVKENFKPLHVMQAFNAFIEDLARGGTR